VKIGLFLALYADRTLEEALDAAAAAGCDHVEIVSGATSPHCRPAELLADPAACRRLAAAVSERGLQISALSCHGNALHPSAYVAEAADQAYCETVRLAAELGVSTVITFSGCPGESEHSLRPSWIFRSVGAGHPVVFWRELAGALRDAGYDGALSIEHEDPLLSPEEGLAVAVATLREALAP
jgi:sugar phosphate isomerase/epimerase